MPHPADSLCLAPVTWVVFDFRMRLKDKVALITGAASGIGKATVQKFILEGARVVATDIDADGLAALADETDGVEISRGDVTNQENAISLVKQSVDRFGRLDVLVNSAGITARSVDSGVDFEARWDAVIQVNVKGTMLMSHAAAGVMRTQGGGSIINLGSIMGLVGYPTLLPFSDGFNPYPTSKGAVAQFTRDIGVRLAKEGIRVNAVCPGFVYTPLTENVTKNPEVHQVMQQLHPMGRMGYGNEIANVVAFLASDEASFVTGAVWTVDGGYTAQ